MCFVNGRYKIVFSAAWTKQFSYDFIVKLWWSWLGLYVRCLVSSTYYHCDCVIRTSRPDQQTVLFWRNCVHTRKYLWAGYTFWQLPSSFWSFLTFLSSFTAILSSFPAVCFFSTYMYNVYMCMCCLTTVTGLRRWQAKMMTKLMIQGSMHDGYKLIPSTRRTVGSSALSSSLLAIFSVLWQW